MNSKSMGTFIAELRKEKGITQRELAEFLNVSDKTISHWECDENSPDLSVIPIIAEYFGVTCDELLKGERKEESVSPDKLQYNPQTAEKDPAESKIRINKAYSKHKIFCIASIFISVFFIAASMLIIKIVEMIEYSRDFENIAFVFSMVFFPCLCILLTFISKHMFMNTLRSCNFESTEIKKWKTKANLVCVAPIIYSAAVIFILVKMLMPVPSALEPHRMTVPSSVTPDSSEAVPYDAYTTVPFSEGETTTDGHYSELPIQQGEVKVWKLF